MQLLSPLFLLAISRFALGDDDLTLTGTWSSKSNTVFTGSGFYDPVDELLIEPALPGISYSFTEDGYFEEAVYQVTSNARNHSCPAAALTYQHGTFQVFDNGSLALNPIAVDGRQLVSQPCQDNGVSTYNRYTQEELFLKYELSIDDYYGRYKLSLYEWDGTPMQPLYLAYRPPMMLPTETLNPTKTGDGTQQTSSASTTGKTKRSLREKVRRSLENKDRTRATRQTTLHYDFWWWGSVALVALGGVTYVAV